MLFFSIKTFLALKLNFGLVILKMTLGCGCTQNLQWNHFILDCKKTCIFISSCPLNALCKIHCSPINLHSVISLGCLWLSPFSELYHRSQSKGREVNTLNLSGFPCLIIERHRIQPYCRNTAFLFCGPLTKTHERPFQEDFFFFLIKKLKSSDSTKYNDLY